MLPHPKTCIAKVYELLHAASLSSEASSHQKPAEPSQGFYTQKAEADGMSWANILGRICELIDPKIQKGKLIFFFLY